MTLLSIENNVQPIADQRFSGGFALLLLHAGAAEKGMPMALHLGPQPRV